ncbi:MAG: hypothetical protein KA791_11215 [Flavobacteriales bacterium]|nr:hypothetical protein [Flavobacteriales bacterium]
MMRLRQPVFSIALVLTGTSLAQQPFPTASDSGTWSVLTCIYGIGVWCQTETCAYDATDTLCGSTWSVYSWPTFGLDPGIAYVRNEGQRTLLRRTTDCLDKEYVIYDFSMEVGDSVYAPMNMDLIPQDTTLFILQDIDTVDVLGVERRRFTLLFDPCNGNFANASMEWIEGIGSTMHPFYSVDCLCDFCEQSLTLLCYDSSGVQLFVDPVFQTCDTLITTVDEPSSAPANVLSVLYDATAGSLIVTVDQDVQEQNRSGLTLVLVAGDGRMIRRQGLSASASRGVRMDVASLASGAYVLLLTDGHERLAGRRIVIHQVD